MIKPHVMVYAGPNGSGKSTVTERLSIVGTYINADEIKKARGCSDIEAATEAEQLRELHVLEKRDFTFETVMSTDRNLKLLEKAKEAGYYIESVFVLTDSPYVNVTRVETRALDGGHDVPVDKIISRYAKSLGLLPRLIEISDKCVIFDNTIRPRIIFVKERETYSVRPNDIWSESRINMLLYGETI